MSFLSSFGIFLLFSIFPANILHTLANDTPFSVEQEIEELLQNAPTYAPEIGGIERRQRDFEKTTLAFLFLSAVKEKYSVVGINVLGQSQRVVKKTLLDDPGSIFDESDASLFSYKSWVRLTYDLIPDFEKLSQGEIKKLETFEKLENLRSQLLKALIDSDPSVKSLSEKMAKTIRGFPGNSDDARIKYLRAKYIDALNSEEIASLEDDLNFEAKIAPILLDAVEPKNFYRSEFFFKMLARYFKANYSEANFVFWTKFVPIVNQMETRTFIRNLDGFFPYKYDDHVYVRFYFSKGEEFRRIVLENEIPVQTLASWQGIKKDPRGPQRALWVLQCIKAYLNVQKGHLTAKAKERTERAYHYILKDAVKSGLVTEDAKNLNEKPEFEEIEFVEGDFEIEFEDGTSIDEYELFGARPVEKVEIGIPEFSYSGDGFSIDATNDKETKNLQTHFSEGFFGVSADIPRSYGVFPIGDEEHAVIGWKKQEFRVRSVQRQLTISSLVLKGTKQAREYFTKAFGLK